jgi:hypothetical protein
MVVHQVFAQITEGEVKNITVCDDYEMANFLARATYGENAFAVDCLQYPCGIGDKYHDGGFYRIKDDGSEMAIEYVPTAEAQLPTLSSKVAYLSMMTDIETETEEEDE